MTEVSLPGVLAALAIVVYLAGVVWWALAAVEMRRRIADGREREIPDRWVAFALLTCWAWPIWVAGWFVNSTIDLIYVVAGKDPR